METYAAAQPQPGFTEFVPAVRCFLSMAKLNRPCSTRSTLLIRLMTAKVHARSGLTAAIADMLEKKDEFNAELLAWLSGKNAAAAKAAPAAKAVKKAAAKTAKKLRRRKKLCRRKKSLRPKKRQQKKSQPSNRRQTGSSKKSCKKGSFKNDQKVMMPCL